MEITELRINRETVCLSLTGRGDFSRPDFERLKPPLPLTNAPKTSFITFAKLDILERSIFGELDGFGGALGDAGPALNTFFWMDRIRFILFHLIDLAGTNLNAVSTTRAFVFINHRVHIQDLKFQIAPACRQARISNLGLSATSKNVSPAKAGIQFFESHLDSRFGGSDKECHFLASS